jgi:hypothetical protein
MMVFFTKKTSFLTFQRFMHYFEWFGLKFAWQTHLQYLSLRSKFEVLMAQPLPKLATATKQSQGGYT